MSAALTELVADVDLSGWPVVAIRLDNVTGTAHLAALVGAVYVLPDRAAARFGTPDRAAAQRPWGCVVEAVHDQDAGRAWLLAHLNPDDRT